MTDKSKSSGEPSGPRIAQDGHQPLFTPKNPGAGHQPVGTGVPKPPRGVPPVKPPLAKK